LDRRADSYRPLIFDTILGKMTLTDSEHKPMDLTAQTDQRSRLNGKVTDPHGAIQPGLTVSLHQTNPARLVAHTAVSATGSYSFDDLAAGIYTLRVAPGTEQAAEQRDIHIDGSEDKTQNIVLPQAAAVRYQVTGKRLLSPQETGNENKIAGQVLDTEGKPLDGKTVRMRWTGANPDTNFPTVTSGQSPFKPRGYFEFIHTPGVFMLDVLDPEHESEVADNLITADMPGRNRPITYDITFQLVRTVRTAARSAIVGRIPGGPLSGAVTLSGGGEPQARRLDQQRSFRFDSLPAGIYQVSLEGVGVIAEEIILNGTDETSLEFPMQGQISGRVQPAAAGEKVSLTCQEYSIRKQAITGADGVYRFVGLPADTYTLTLEASELVAQNAISDGRSASDGPIFDREQKERSVITGRITTHEEQPAAHLIVFLRTPGRRIAEDQTDEDGRYRFAGLGAASYSLEVADVGIIAAAIRLDGVADVERNVRLPAPKTPPVQPIDQIGDSVPARTQPLRHYLLLENSDPTLTGQRLAQAQDYILRTKVAVGFDGAAVTKADRVTIIGAVAPQIIQALAAARIPVQRVSGDLNKIRQELEALL